MRWSSVRVFVRPCSGNRLQSTSHENSYRGPTGDLFDLIFFYTYSWVNGLCFGYFQIFPERSPFDLKITLTLTPFPYVRRLLDLRVHTRIVSSQRKMYAVTRDFIADDSIIIP